jgi:23S rRNA pseudouridine1911/1915/1917 synthase
MSPPEPLFHVLFEDAELLVLHKPAGLVCHPTKGDALSSLVSRVRLYLLGSARNGDSISEPQMVHRLDRETSGVMIFGKTASASLELRRLWEAGLVTKEYLAIVHGSVEAPQGIVEAPIGPDTESIIAIKDRVVASGASARTRWWRIHQFDRPEGSFSVLRVRLDTGRKHQIRIHLEHAGHPLVGDKLYGLDEQFYLHFVQRRLTSEQRARLLLPCQALHAHRIWLPWNGEEREFRSPPEAWFTQFIEGAPSHWEHDPFDPNPP